MMRNNFADGEAISSKWLSKAIETAQKKVEARHYDARKQVVEYDDVMNDQRKVIYEQRSEIMDSKSVEEMVTDMRHDTVNSVVLENCPPGTYPEQWNIQGLKEQIAEVLAVEADIDAWLEEDMLAQEVIEERLIALVDEKIAKKAEPVDPQMWRDLEKSVLLQNLDHQWKEHLATLDALRQVVFLRAYAQKTPLNEYKQEAFVLFERMLYTIREEVTKTLLKLQLRAEPVMPELPELPDFLTTHEDPFTGEDNSNIDNGNNPMGTINSNIGGAAAADQFAPPNSRNAPCPCGSGRKYKHCHGQVV